MNFPKIIPNSVTSKLALGALRVKNVSPNVLFVGGVVGVAATVVVACRATLKLEGVLDEINSNLEQVDRAAREKVASRDEVRQAKTVIYTQAVVRIGKLYLPSLGLAAVSVAMLCGSHNILTKRNAALTAAYATLDRGFKDYRGRVVEKLGEDQDKEFLHGVDVEKVVEIDEATGKKKLVEKKRASGLSAYGRLFNAQSSPGNYQRNHPEMNLVFLRAQQNYLNDRLQTQGYLILNDAYDALGFERSKEGMVVGWLADGKGDGYVDFGIFHPSELHKISDFMMTPEGEIYIDFNVDGTIFDKLRG